MVEAKTELLALIGAHTVSMVRYKACSDDDWNNEKIKGSIDADIDHTRRALLDHRCQHIEEVQIKATFMSSCKSFNDWDDLDRVEIIKALIPAVQS